MFTTQPTFDLNAEKGGRAKYGRRSSMEAMQLPMSTSDSTCTHSNYDSVQSVEYDDPQGQDLMMTTQSINSGFG